MFPADHESAGERAVPHRSGAHDGRPGRHLLPLLPRPADGHHPRHRRHLRRSARPTAAVAVQRLLRHAVLPAGARLPCGERQAGGGSPAPRQDAVGRRGPHPPQAPGAAHPPALAAHPAHLPGGQPLRPDRGHGMVRGERRRLHLRPGGQSRPAPSRIRCRRRSQGAPRRGRRRQDARLRRLRLRRRFVAPETPRRRPAGGDDPRLRRPLHRHLAHGTGRAISTKGSTAPAARPRTSSSCTRASSPPTGPPARARSPTSSGWCCTPPPTG